MMGKVQGNTFAAAAMSAVLLLLAGCQTAPKAPGVSTVAAPSPADTAAAPAGGQPPVNTGNCPQISLRDGTAYLRKYAKGAKDDPAKLIVQASLADTTRQCGVSNGQFTLTVMAQGRLVPGPMGKPGTFSLPVRVAVLDGDQTIYSNLEKFNAELPAGQSSAQFLYSKQDIVIPGGVSPTARIYLGFDEGPYNTK